MIYFQLVYEFIKISLFSFGGGYGTLPFIYYLANQYSWYSVKEIMHMVAIAAITPGAFGVNMATYTGFKTAGVIGAFLTTLALIIPSMLLSIGIYKILRKYKDSIFMKDFLETLRAIASGLLFVVVLQMINQEIFHFELKTMKMNFDPKAFLFLIISILLYFLVKKNIPVTMLLTLAFGIFMKYYGII
ncbi:chromate transporter [bacterium]|nr:chromate transporter [bacterium]